MRFGLLRFRAGGVVMKCFRLKGGIYFSALCQNSLISLIKKATNVLGFFCRIFFGLLRLKLLCNFFISLQ